LFLELDLFSTNSPLLLLELPKGGLIKSIVYETETLMSDVLLRFRFVSCI